MRATRKTLTLFTRKLESSIHIGYKSDHFFNDDKKVIFKLGKHY